MQPVWLCVCRVVAICVFRDGNCWPPFLPAPQFPANRVEGISGAVSSSPPTQAPCTGISGLLCASVCVCVCACIAVLQQYRPWCEKCVFVWLWWVQCRSVALTVRVFDSPAPTIRGEASSCVIETCKRKLTVQKVQVSVGTGWEDGHHNKPRMKPSSRWRKGAQPLPGWRSEPECGTEETFFYGALFFPTVHRPPPAPSVTFAFRREKPNSLRLTAAAVADARTRLGLRHISPSVGQHHHHRHHLCPFNRFRPARFALFCTRTGAGATGYT